MSKRKINKYTWIGLAVFVILVVISFSYLVGNAVERAKSVLSFTTVNTYERSPAESAEEWSKRFIGSGFNSHNFASQFAELPLQSQWEGVIKTLKNSDQKFRSEKSKEAQNIFACLLEGDHSQATDLYKKRIKGKKFSQYQYRNTLQNFLKLGIPLEEAQKIISLESSNSEPSEPSWKKFLAQGELEQAVQELQAENTESSWETVYQIGVLYENSDYIEKGLKGLRTVGYKEFNKDNSFKSYYDLKTYFNALHEQKKHPEIVQFFRKIHSKTHASQFGREDLLPYYFHSIHTIKGAKALFKELKSLEDFGIESKGQFLELLTYNSDINQKLGLVIVESLVELNETLAAKAFLQNLLVLHGGYDPYYQYFLNNFTGEVSFLDQLLKWNPYEERPLIWKAYYLLSQERLDEAEVAIKAAIRLDPSDGEQGKETRMEVYNVKSELLRKKGDLVSAQFFKEVMLAIRAGEVADDYLFLGLTEEAVQRYKSALGHFEDAYCLQSRLAKSLLEQGKIEEAKVHFKKAFSLMPVSFGPVESHCFGCEGIFKNELSQQMAEKVFLQIVQATPENPRTYYLIGKLYEEVGKSEQAAQYYLEAFKRDKNYFNCAKRLYHFLLVDADFKKANPKLLQEIIECYPYKDLRTLFEVRLDLRTSWLDAQRVSEERSVPITLPQINPSFLNSLPLSGENKKSYVPDILNAIDGWTASELLRGNDFLNSLSWN